MNFWIPFVSFAVEISVSVSHFVRPMGHRNFAGRYFPIDGDALTVQIEPNGTNEEKESKIKGWKMKKQSIKCNYAV